MTEMEKFVICGVLTRARCEDLKIERRSEREYDLTLSGRMNGTLFSAWLPLLSIRETTDWTSREIARMTDYPSMVTEGDWSGVRDSDTDKIMAIFLKFVVQPIKQLVEA